MPALSCLSGVPPHAKMDRRRLVPFATSEFGRYDLPEFQIVSEFAPTGDQPQAVDQVVEGIEKGMVHQSLMGVTGSGKTFTMANVIERVQRPTLVIAHNKTLAAQLATEFKEFFPYNAVEYFVSYYDYYQPEAYIPRHRSIHRERRGHQRGAGQTQARGDSRAADTAGRTDRGVCVVHLRPWFSGRVPGIHGPRGQGRDTQSGAAISAAHRHAVRAQRF